MHDEPFKDVFRRLTARTPQPPEFAELEIQHATPVQGTQAKPWMVLVGAAAVVLLIVGGVSILTNTALPDPGGVASPAPTTTTTTTPAPFSIPEDCPVTIPGGGFTPPESHPESPSSWPDSVWHGSDELWTVLAIDGDHGYRKSVWWSANFPGGGVEEDPPISTTWRLLNSERDVMLQIDDGTNAYTVEDGWFMISGIDPNYAGCWEVTAHYKGATLSYVYYLADGLDPSLLEEES